MTIGFLQPNGQPSFCSFPTVQSLVGPNADLPESIATASLRAPACIGSANVIRERNPQFSAMNDGGRERITLIVDSGASDTVIPPKVCRATEIKHSSKVGNEYEVADGGDAKNLGDKCCEMKVHEPKRSAQQWLEQWPAR